MMHKKHIIRIAAVTVGILLVPLAAMQLTDEVNWTLSDFVVMGAALFGVGLVYELIAKKPAQTLYRAAFTAGLLGAFLLFWVNGAVGIIGSEDNPANLLYGAVFLTGLIGSLISGWKARGMALTLYVAAAVQFLVPVFALFIWPAQTSWGEAGVIGVMVVNAIFVALFLVSGLLFGRAAHEGKIL